MRLARPSRRPKAGELSSNSIYSTGPDERKQPMKHERNGATETINDSPRKKRGQPARQTRRRSSFTVNCLVIQAKPENRHLINLD